MRIDGPTNPHHLRIAYGVAPTRPLPSAQAPSGIEPIHRPRPSDAASRLVAATTPGGVDFSPARAAARTDAIQMYRHPADRNAAATAVALGRAIDVSG